MVADFSVRLQAQQGFERLRERRAAAPVKKVKVQAVGPQALEAFFAGRDRAAPGGVLGKHLAYEKNLVTPAGDRLADEFLRSSAAVHLRRIDEREAVVEAHAQRCDLFSSRGAMVAHVPGALAEGRNKFARGQRDCLHARSLTAIRYGIITADPGPGGRWQCPP